VKRTRVVWAVLALLVIGGAGLATAADLKPATRMTDDLAALHDHYVAASAARVPLDVTDSLLPVADDLVTIDATATDDPNVLAAHLHALGARDVAVGGWRVSARVPVGALPSLQTLTSLRFAWPAYSATNVGAVTSQGDVAMRADVARNRFGLDGTGVTVGVLSDSFGCIAGGVATGMANGDLPTVTVLQEDAPCTGGTDEGRAMLEIVHDVAPGATLAFATANLGMASFAANIRALRDGGAKVIVDDVFYFAEPMFQDGVIAQAVNDVAASGVAYFSSAGNQARQAYDSAFVPGTVYTAADPRLGGNVAFFGGTAHDFGGTPFQTFTLRAGTAFTMVLQWDSPFFSVSGPPGTVTDLDVYVLNSAGTQVLFGVASNNIASGDPVEILRVSCGGPGNCSAAFLFVKHAGPNPGRFKYVLLQAVGNVTTNPELNSGTIYGHANALGAVAVGAARYQQTPAFGVSPALLESFSSVGTTPILFGLSGNRLATPDLRASKPEIVAPDGADTSFFGSDSDADGFPNFFGTSAAAPHAAAVGALMLQAVPTLTPAQIRTALQNTALDMAAPGFDNDTGFGLIQADAALTAAGAKVATTTSLNSSANPAVAGQPVTFTAHVSVSVPDAVTPSGMVTFFDGAIMLGTAVLDLGGTGSFTTSALTVDQHGITAQYGGDVNSAPSTSSALTEAVFRGDTTTVVAASANPTIFGQAVTFTATVSPVAPGTKTPTGPVTFLDGGLPLGTAPLNATGQATFTTSTLAVGSRLITAAYPGDLNETPSASAPVTQTIMPAPSSTVVTASPSPTTFGRAVTLTATVKTVAPGAGTPTGVVTFFVDGAPLGVVPLDLTGRATLTTSTLLAGTRTILASYGGDANVLPNPSSAITLMLARAATTTTLTTSANPTVTGQPLTLTATVGLVAPSLGLATGPVTFRDGMTVLGVVALGPTGQATLPAALATGTRSLTAGFGGDANTNPSTSAARAQTLAKATTSMTLTTSINTLVIGQSVTFTATRTVVAPGAGTPTGGVMFFNGAVALGPAVTPDAAGVATLTTSALTLGPHAITARYAGDAGFATSTSSPLTVTIAKASTATIVTASANPAAWHQSVTLTAAVSVLVPGGGSPTGVVTFFNGPTALGTGMLSALGRATLTTRALTVGDHAITARYGGTPSFNGSVSSVFTETIVPAPSSTALTAAPNPAVTGRPVVLTATVVVVAPAAGTPTGTVTFLDGPTPLGTVPLTAGHATLTVKTLAVATHALTASYDGDGNVAPSTSTAATQTINLATTTTTVTSSANPAVTGRAVTFTAKVSVVAPGVGTPTGAVTFMDGATPLGTAPLDAARQATLTTSALPVGAHPITAVYDGDAGFATSTSLVLTETIGKAATKTTVASSATPVVHGVPVTFTATVTVVAPGAGTPTGTVTFLDGVTVLGAATLDAGGQAALTTSALVAGARSITARYGGDGSFTASASGALAEAVTKASTSTSLATSTGSRGPGG
jgi:hypothetical protein